MCELKPKPTEQLSRQLNTSLLLAHHTRVQQDYIICWVQQPCKCTAADFKKNVKNRFYAFFIPVHAQHHSCWYRLIEYACLGCPVLLCKFQFPRCKSLGNITDLLTSIAVTGLLQCRRAVGWRSSCCAETILYRLLVFSVFK